MTTNLDTQRLVIWNIGAIAASGAPGADELFRTVLTASASIPGIFTPTMITVESGGRLFREMHVDGGVMSNVFIVPDGLLLHDTPLPIEGKADVYVIINGKLEPSFEVINNRTTEIAGRAVSTMIQVHSRAILQATYAFSRRNRMGFHLTYIPTDVDDAGTMTFDTEEMRRLFAYGYDRGLSGMAWVSTLLGSQPRATSGPVTVARMHVDQP